MKPHELTDRAWPARTLPMQGDRGQGRGLGRSRGHAVAAAMAVAGAMAAGGCVSVNAPDKPIVIELNINIKQEVIYRLAQDAGNTIDKNPEIF